MTDYNGQFQKSFTCKSHNWDTNNFRPQAAWEFEKAMVELFGPSASSHDILYCYKASVNHQPLYIGTSEAIQSFLRNKPAVAETMKIQVSGPNFVVTTAKGETKPLVFPKTDTMVALYTRVGWNGTASVTILDQFRRDRQLGRIEAVVQDANSGGEVIKHTGFTEHVYRLLFDYQDKYATTPLLHTVLSDGTIENTEDLLPQKGKALMAYAFPQTVTEDVAQTLQVGGKALMAYAFSQAVYASEERLTGEGAQGSQPEKAVEDLVTENSPLQRFLSGPHSDDLFLSSAESILSMPVHLSPSTDPCVSDTHCGTTIDFLIGESASRLRPVSSEEVFKNLKGSALAQQHPAYGDFLQPQSFLRMQANFGPPSEQEGEEEEPLEADGVLLGWPLWGAQKSLAPGPYRQKALLDTAKQVINTALERHDVIEVRYAKLGSLSSDLMEGNDMEMMYPQHAFVFEKIRVDGSEYWVLHQSWQSMLGLEFTHAQWMASPPCADTDAESSDREDFYEAYLACTRGFAGLPDAERQHECDAYMEEEHRSRQAYVKELTTSFAPVHRRWGGGRLIPRVAVQYYLEQLAAVVGSWESGLQQSLMSAAEGWNNLRPDNPNAWWHVRNAVPVLLDLVPRETFAGEPKKAACFDILLAFRDQMAAWGSKVCEDKTQFTGKVKGFLLEHYATPGVDGGCFPEIAKDLWGKTTQGAVTVSDSLKELVGSSRASRLPGMLFLACFDRVDESAKGEA